MTVSQNYFAKLFGVTAVIASRWKNGYIKPAKLIKSEKIFKQCDVKAEEE